MNKSFQEEIAQFFEQPNRESFRDLLKTNAGEFTNCDFKQEMPEYPKLAKTVLGISNSGGGCIILGVSEKDDGSLESIGVERIEDKAIITKGIGSYIPNRLMENDNVAVVNFQYDSSEYTNIVGKKFQAILINDIPSDIPFISQKNGKGITENIIYVRRGTSTEPANYDELQRIINRRLSTGNYISQTKVDLETHLQQLSVLYSQIPEYNIVRGEGIIHKSANSIARSINAFFGEIEQVKNPNYPDEGVEEFISKMINKKKKRIEIELDVSNL